MTESLSKHDAPVVLSPHLDDAAFSLWHVLSGHLAPAEVITVFAGVPRAGVLTPLDRQAGAEDSSDWMLRRRDEDADALAVAGLAPRHLDLLDIQYVVHDDPKLSAIVAGAPSFSRALQGRISLPARVAEIARVLPHEALAGRVIYAPLSVGAHPDHRAVTLFALRLADQGHEVRLWADSPYWLRYGLPTWLGGGFQDSRPDEYVAEALAAFLTGRIVTDFHVTELAGSAVALKAAAVAAYQTQHAALSKSFGAAMDLPLLGYEAVWTLAPGFPDRIALAP
jgi:LmbE family N-acetylglucosaminyl deacetylase